MRRRAPTTSGGWRSPTDRCAAGRRTVLASGDAASCPARACGRRVARAHRRCAWWVSPAPRSSSASSTPSSASSSACRSGRSRRSRTGWPTSPPRSKGAQLLAREAAWAADEGEADAVALARMAFLFAARAAQDTSAAALHVHGGYGFTLEYDVQLYLRRAKAWPLALGDPRRGHPAPRRRAVRPGGTGSADRWRPDGLPAGRAQRRVPRRGPCVPGRALRPRDGRARPRHRHVAQLGVPPGARRAGVDRGVVARGVRRPGPRSDGDDRAARRAAPGRRPDRRSRSDDHDRPHPPGRRHRGAEAAVHPSRAGGRDPLRPRLHRTRLGLRRRRGEDPRRARRRRVGHRRPEDVHDVGPRGHVRLPAHPHEPRRAQAQGPHHVPRAARRARASRSTPCTRWAGSAPTPPSTPTCACPTRCASARSTAAGTS